MSTTRLRSRTPSGAAYAMAGEGEPLVLVHGVGMRLEAWTPQIEALKDHWRVIALDMPGHGESSPLGEKAALPDFVHWLSTALGELGLGPVNIAGHSMGALIAGGLVAERPEQVRRVALLNGVHRRSAEARAAVMQRAAEIVTGTFDREAPLKRWFGPGHEHEAAYALCRDMLASVDAHGYATAYRAFAAGDGCYADRWSDVTCPALFLTGDGDLNSTPQMAEAMAASARQGRAVIVPGHRHMVNLTAHEAVNAALRFWLRQDAGEREMAS